MQISEEDLKYIKSTLEWLYDSTVLKENNRSNIETECNGIFNSLNVIDECLRQYSETSLQGIWTEEENFERQGKNLWNHKKETCKDCHFGGSLEEDKYVTCGYHIQNFTKNSWCDYFVRSDDKKLNEYNKKRQQELKEKIEARRRNNEM